MPAARVKFPFVATDGAGNVVAGASVDIVNRETGGAPTVYQTASGAATRSLPLTTAASGRPPVSWVERGSYDVTITATEIGSDTFGWEAAPASGGSIDPAWSPAESRWMPGDFKATGAAVTAGNEQAGWLLCDGRAVSRTIYPNLFSAIGTTYGVGDNSTTFNLPDLRDASLIGASTTRPRGTKGGEASHQLTVAEMPAHTHPYDAMADSGSKGQSGAQFTTYTPQVFNTASKGGDQPHNNMPPFTAAGGWLIKT